MDTTTLSDELTVATDTPPTWSELIANRLADVVDPTDGERAGIADAVDETETTEATTVERSGRPRSGPPDLDRGWVLVAPLTSAIALTTVSVLVEPNPLRTGTSASGLAAFVVLTSFLLVCVAGTLALLRDAARLRALGTDWSPNPWHYVVPSALTLAALHAYRMSPELRSVDGVVAFAVGSLVVALVTSSILAGPAYLLQRRRRLGSD